MFIKIFNLQVTASDISKGKGFVSEVLRCIIYFVDSTSKSNIYTTILKIPGLESMISSNENGGTKFPVHDDKFINHLTECHQTEADFYKYLSKTLDIPVPYVFKTLPWKIGESQGLIHMEDMTGKGKSLPIGDALTIPQIKEVTRHLAHMHRKTLTSEDEEFLYWKGKHNNNQLIFMLGCKALNDIEPFLNICGDRSKF